MKIIGSFLIYLLNKNFPGENIKLDVAYGPKESQKFDEYPSNNKSAPIVIFWYGGSWKNGSKKIYHFIGHKLQKYGACAFIVDYPKYPEQKFPGFLEDAMSAIKKIKSLYPDRKIILMGHSAGANTVLILGLSKKKIADKVISISGVCTLWPWRWRDVFGDAIDKGLHDPRNYVISANKETEFLLIHGKLDFTVKAKDSITLYNEMQGNKIKSRLILITLMDHVLILFFIFVGPLFITRHRLKVFINS